MQLVLYLLLVLSALIFIAAVTFCPFKIGNQASICCPLIRCCVAISTWLKWGWSVWSVWSPSQSPLCKRDPCPSRQTQECQLYGTPENHHHFGYVTFPHCVENIVDHDLSLFVFGVCDVSDHVIDGGVWSQTSILNFSFHTGLRSLSMTEVFAIRAFPSRTSTKGSVTSWERHLLLTFLAPFSRFLISLFSLVRLSLTSFLSFSSKQSH